MFFKRSVQRYGRSPEPQTPYQRAGQLWDERLGLARVQARSWRYMAFGTMLLAGVLTGGIVWQARQSRVVPYVVEVDRLGEARAVSEAEVAHRPTDPEVAWYLAHFIGDVRSVPLDPVLMRRSWLEAYDFTTRRGARILSDYAHASDPFAKIGERAVSVQVTSVVRASDRSFQIKWTESVFDHGAAAGSSHWTGIVTVLSAPPATADVLRRNPLGLYVDAIDWSREFDPAPVPGAAETGARAIAGGRTTAPAEPLDPASQKGLSL